MEPIISDEWLGFVALLLDSFEYRRRRVLYEDIRGRLTEGEVPMAECKLNTQDTPECIAVCDFATFSQLMDRVLDPNDPVDQIQFLAAEELAESSDP